jgi:hypothetical protein
MSINTSIFATTARSGSPTVTNTPPRIIMDGQQTIMKLCTRCQSQMPHKIGKQVCIYCEMDEDAIRPTETNRLDRG